MYTNVISIFKNYRISSHCCSVSKSCDDMVREEYDLGADHQHSSEK